jgi:hypothetical protein
MEDELDESGRTVVSSLPAVLADLRLTVNALCDP